MQRTNKSWLIHTILLNESLSQVAHINPPADVFPFDSLRKNAEKKSKKFLFCPAALRLRLEMRCGGVLWGFQWHTETPPRPA